MAVGPEHVILDASDGVKTYTCVAACILSITCFEVRVDGAGQVDPAKEHTAEIRQTEGVSATA